MYIPRLRAIATTICAVALVAIIPLTGGSASATTPPQCDDPNANLYDYPASVAQACGFATVPVERVVSRADGGADYIYSINGHEVDLAQPPVNFDPLTASDAQLTYYGFPPRPTAPASYTSWANEVSGLHVVSPTQFLILMPTIDTYTNLCAYGNNQAEACWGGYVNTGRTYSASYIDYIEPTENQSNCPDDDVLAWTGIDGYNDGYVAQAGTAPFYENKDHYTWWEFWPDINDVVPWKLTVTAGDDIRVHVSWLSDSSKYAMQVTDASTGQMTQVATYSPPTDERNRSSAEYIIERPTTKDNQKIHELRNFDAWFVNSAQAATGGGNTIGLQNYPHTQLDIYDKTSGDQLEYTSGISLDGFTSTWWACD